MDIEQLSVFGTLKINFKLSNAPVLVTGEVSYRPKLAELTLYNRQLPSGKFWYFGSLRITGARLSESGRETSRTVSASWLEHRRVPDELLPIVDQYFKQNSATTDREE